MAPPPGGCRRLRRRPPRDGGWPHPPRAGPLRSPLRRDARGGLHLCPASQFRGGLIRGIISGADWAAHAASWKVGTISLLPQEVPGRRRDLRLHAAVTTAVAG